MSYPNKDKTEHDAFHQTLNPNCEYCHEPKSMLTAMLNDMKGQKMPRATFYGDLNILVPRQSDKWRNLDNPR